MNSYGYQRQLRDLTHFGQQGSRWVLALLVIASSLLAIEVHPQRASAALSSDSFACDGTFYQTRFTTGNGTSLYKINRSVVPYTSTLIAQLTTGTNVINGDAYNPLDGYIYGWYSGSSNLAIINNTGVVTTKAVTGASNTLNATAATIDKTGMYYAMATNSSSALQYYTIDTTQVTPALITHALTNTGPVAFSSFTTGIGDLVLDPTDTNVMYLTAGGSFMKINISAGTIQTVNATTPLPSTGIGTLFIDSAGVVYGYANSGEFYQINKATGIATLLNDADPSSASDGADCSNEPVSIDSVKSAPSNPQAVAPDTFDIPYTVQVANTSGNGAAILHPQLTESLARTFSDGTPIISLSHALSLNSGGCSLNAGFNGLTDTRLLNPSNGTLADGAKCSIGFTVHLVYPTAAAIPTSFQSNTVYASATSSTPNNGFTFNTAGDPTPPIDLLSADLSTNGTTLPTTSHADTPAPTTITLNATLAAATLTDTGLDLRTTILSSSLVLGLALGIGLKSSRVHYNLRR